MSMPRTPSKPTPLRPDGKPMTADDIRELRERIAEFDTIEVISDEMRGWSSGTCSISRTACLRRSPGRTGPTARPRASGDGAQKCPMCFGISTDELQ